MKKMLFLAGAASLALAGNAMAAQRQGVVVKIDRPAKLVAIADVHGRVALLHAQAPARLRPGARVAVAVRPLKNGTFAAGAFRVLGKAPRAHVRGIVVARRPGKLFVAARGAVLQLRTAVRKARTTAAAGAAPTVGSAVDASVSITGTGLAAGQTDVLDPAGNSGAFEGTVTAVGDGTITVSEDGVAVTFAVPAGLDVSGFSPGDEVLAYFSQSPDGSFSLNAIAGDDNAAEANDAEEIDGDVGEAETEVAADESDDPQVQSDPADDGEQAEPDDDAGDDQATTSDDGGMPTATSDDGSDDQAQQGSDDSGETASQDDSGDQSGGDSEDGGDSGDDGGGGDD